jgi:hypothetical protein
MTEEKIKKFINETSKKEDSNDWYSCVNFIYTGESEENSKLSSETIKEIEDTIKKAKDDALISLLVDMDGFDITNRKKWVTCINNHIRKPKKEYLKNLFKNKSPLNYIVFSEAPMLTWKKGGDPSSNYIFRKCKVKGSYRSAPYKVFNTPKNKAVTNSELIDTFSRERVAFIDLIDLPIPISTQLRCKWNYEIKINCKPLTIVFLENALLNFLREMIKGNVDLVPNFEFAFMMPPQTAFGIIEYIRDNGPINVQDGGKSITIDYLKTIECNSYDTKKIFGYLKEEILPLYARIAMGGSNNPSDKLLKRALNIL